MSLEQELFRNDPKYVYLKNATEGMRKQAVFVEELRNIICIADESLFPQDLLMVEGSVVEGTGLVMQASFVTKDGTVDYCFQDGKDNGGRDVSTLVKVINFGKVDPYYGLFLQRNQVITPDDELLEAHYLATYQEGRWYVLDKADREGKLDCESEEVLARAQEIVVER